MRYRRIIIYFSLLIFVSIGIYGCASWGIARLPAKDKLFVSDSREDGFIMAGTLDYPYQPLGYVAIDNSELTLAACLPGADPLNIAYKSLEKVLSDKLVQKAKKEMGADGVISVIWTSTPGVITYVSVRGLAVKRK